MPSRLAAGGEPFLHAPPAGGFPWQDKNLLRFILAEGRRLAGGSAVARSMRKEPGLDRGICKIIAIINCDPNIFYIAP
jgi:hypothetical protein